MCGLASQSFSPAVMPIYMQVVNKGGKLACNTDVHTVGGYKLTCEMHAHTGCQSINLTGYVALS